MGFLRAPLALSLGPTLSSPDQSPFRLGRGVGKPLLEWRGRARTDREPDRAEVAAGPQPGQSTDQQHRGPDAVLPGEAIVRTARREPVEGQKVRSTGDGGDPAGSSPGEQADRESEVASTWPAEAAVNARGTSLTCKRCDHRWHYRGRKRPHTRYPVYVSCPRCRTLGRLRPVAAASSNGGGKR